MKSGIPSPVTCIAQTRKLVPKSIMYPSDPTGRELTGSRPVVALITRRARESSSPHWTEMSPTTMSANICGGPLRVQPVVQEFKSWRSGGEQLIVQKGNHGGKHGTSVLDPWAPSAATTGIRNNPETPAGIHLAHMAGWIQIDTGPPGRPGHVELPDSIFSTHQR